METEDPRAALGAKDLPTQTAAARDLALMGTWDDIPRLMELATGHKRVGLRLVAAASAADILHRYRTGAAGETLDPARADEVIAWVKRTDPGVNPSALMLLSALPGRTVIDRLGRLLRDPRNDVRTGAAVALRRMASSHTLFGDDPSLAYLRRQVGTWMTDRRTPPDALTALIKLVGNLGWEEHREALFGLASTSTPVLEAIEQARERLDLRSTATGWSGLYISDGLDVLEQGDAAADPGLLLVHDGAVSRDLGKARAGQVPPTDDCLRLVWVPRLGQHELVAAIQQRGRTWYRLQDKDLVAWMDTEAHALGPEQRPASGAFVPAVAEIEGAVGKRTQAVAAYLAGDLEAADEALTALTNTKKPRSDLYFWLGELRAEQGRIAEARQAWETFLERAGKRHALKDVTERRLGAQA